VGNGKSVSVIKSSKHIFGEASQFAFRAQDNIAAGRTESQIQNWNIEEIKINAEGSLSWLERQINIRPAADGEFNPQKIENYWRRKFKLMARVAGSWLERRINIRRERTGVQSQNKYWRN